MNFRFFFDRDELHQGEVVELTNSEFHHATHVLRLKSQESITLYNGQGISAKARVLKIGKKQLQVAIEEVAVHQRPQNQILLILAHLRPGHLDFAIEKCTELGIDQFIIYQAIRSESTTLSLHQKQRCSHLAKAAVKQSGNLFLPQIMANIPLTTALSLHPTIPCLFGDLSEGIPTIATQLDRLPPSSLRIVIGPEKGFAEEERLLLQSAGVPVSLHHNTLRAETAAICACFAATLWRGC